WVEVFFPRAGWIAYDPTPPDPERSRWVLGLRTISHAMDLLLYQWDRYVISWSFSDQRGMLEDVADFLRALPGYAAALAGSRTGRRAVVGTTAVALLALALVVRRRRRKRGTDGLAPEAVEIYRRLRSELVRAGLPVAVSTPPGELARRFAGTEAV